jgi:K+-sensing histidine kinase KdpD
MEDISLHILDIVENSIRAGARNIKIKIVEDEVKDILTLIIKDDGCGMDEKTQKKALDPFFTTKKNKKIGLGLPLLSQSVEESGGELKIFSKNGKGTKIIATFRLDNIDTKPKGNIDETIRVLKSTHPEIRFVYEYKNIYGGEKNAKIKKRRLAKN